MTLRTSAPHGTERASWRAVGAAVRGAAHVADGTPCQDAFAIEHARPWLVAAVCDGAGSSLRADLGATAGARAVVERLRMSCQAASPPPDRPYWEREARRAVRAARSAIGEAVGGETPDGLATAHTTLVAVVAHAGGGAFLHVGDGLAAAITASGTVTSAPENGAYANETFFLTEPDWEAHLRVTLFAGPVESLWLLSDGAAALATDAAGRLLPGFTEPVAAYLQAATPDDAEAALRDTLASPASAHLTNDDKTLVWASPVAP